jgi:predicted hydrocarbon binding protein
MTVHTLDQDLLLSDRVSPGTLDQSEAHPICYVTLGMVQACLRWATGMEYDIEETSCRAVGEETCEFRISIGG